MFKQISATIFTKVLNAIFSSIILIINSRYLGAENVGIISLVILSISIILIIYEITGGGAVVYLIPRLDSYKLTIISLIWSLIIIILLSFILFVLKLFPNEYNLYILLISFLAYVNSFILSVLLGNMKIKLYNLLSFFQVLLNLIFLVLFVFLFKLISPLAYLNSLSLSYFLTIFIGIIIIYKNSLFKSKIEKWSYTINEIFKFGIFAQVSKLSQLLNNRLNYYIVEHFLGYIKLGIYSVGNQISESTWIISRSMSTIQYAYIANESEKENSKKIIINLFKIIFILNILILSIILSIPDNFYCFILGKDFIGIKLLLVFMAPGIFIFSFIIILSSYFSGIGKIYHNTITSIIGMICTCISGYFLIPNYGLIGAGIASSVSYLIPFIYLFLNLIIIEKIKFSDLLITKSDLLLFKEYIIKKINYEFKRIL